MKVRFLFPDGTSSETEAYDQLNLLAHAQLVERGVQSRCGGQCECGTCRVLVRSGSVSAMRPPERELLAFAGEARPEARLACQTFPERDGAGDENVVVVEVPGERFADARAKARAFVK